jgi:hypothetical protein
VAMSRTNCDGRKLKRHSSEASAWSMPNVQHLSQILEAVPLNDDIKGLASCDYQNCVWKTYL